LAHWGYIGAAGIDATEFTDDPLDLVKVILRSYEMAIGDYLERYLANTREEEAQSRDSGDWLAPLLFARKAEGTLCALGDVRELPLRSIVPLEERVGMWTEARGREVEVISADKVFGEPQRLLVPSPPVPPLEVAFEELFLNAFKHGRLVGLGDGKRIAEVIVSLVEDDGDIVFELDHPSENGDVSFTRDPSVVIGHSGFAGNKRFFESLLLDPKGLDVTAIDEAGWRFVWRCRFSPSTWSAVREAVESGRRAE